MSTDLCRIPSPMSNSSLSNHEDDETNSAQPLDLSPSASPGLDVNDDISKWSVEEVVQFVVSIDSCQSYAQVRDRLPTHRKHFRKAGHFTCLADAKARVFFPTRQRKSGLPVWLARESLLTLLSWGSQLYNFKGQLDAIPPWERSPTETGKKWTFGLLWFSGVSRPFYWRFHSDTLGRIASDAHFGIEIGPGNSATATN